MYYRVKQRQEDFNAFVIAAVNEYYESVTGKNVSGNCSCTTKISSFDDLVFKDRKFCKWFGKRFKEKIIYDSYRDIFYLETMLDGLELTEFTLKMSNYKRRFER